MTQTELTTIALALLAVAVLGIWLIVRWRRSSSSDLQTMLGLVSLDYLIDFIIPDGNGGEIHIDHLLLTPGGFLLLDTKDVQGAVFAGDRMDTWSATHQGVRLTFDNPIPILQERAAAISLIAPAVPLEYRILFVNQATFPKGHPPAVATMPGILEEFQSIDTAADVSVFDAQWQVLKSAAAVA